MSSFMTLPTDWKNSTEQPRAASIMMHLIYPNGDHEVYLTVLYKSGQFSIPGGRLNRGEKTFNGALRELMEESDLSVSDCKILQSSKQVEVKYTIPGDNGALSCRMYHWFFYNQDFIRDILRDRVLPIVYNAQRQVKNETKYAGLFRFSDILGIARNNSHLSYTFDGKNYSGTLRNCMKHVFTRIKYHRFTHNSAHDLLQIPMHNGQLIRPARVLAPVPARAPAPVPARAPARALAQHTIIPADKWDCARCTFLNDEKLDSCVMCGTICSKPWRCTTCLQLNTVGLDDCMCCDAPRFASACAPAPAPTERACSACTFLNPANASSCGICGTLF